MAETTFNQGIEFHPLTPDRWSDLEALFGERGAYSGCWCMFWRLRRVEFAMCNGSRRNRPPLLPPV